MSIFVRFKNHPAEPHIRTVNVKSQAVKILSNEKVVGLGEVAMVAYTQDLNEGLLVLKLKRNLPSLINGTFYSGSFDFIKSDDGTRMVQVSLNNV